METARTREHAAPGWIVEVTGHRLGDAPRSGEILAVIGDAQHPHYRVRWEDGRESLFFPGSDVVLRPPARQPDL
jgi:hypothetical protein